MLQRAECGVQKVQTSMAALVRSSYCCVTQSYQQQTSCQVIRMVSHHNYEQRTHKTSNMKDSLYLCKNGSAEHQHGVTFALPSRFAAGGSCRNDTDTSKHVIPCFCSCKRVISPHDVTPSRQLTNVWALLPLFCSFPPSSFFLELCLSAACKQASDWNNTILLIIQCCRHNLVIRHVVTSNPASE